MQQRSCPLTTVLVRAAVQSGSHLNSVGDLAAAGGVSERTFREWCRAEKTGAKACLDCVRCLKLVMMVAAHGAEWDPRASLSKYYRDKRTVNRLLATGGLHQDAPPSVVDFLLHQRFVRSHRLRSEIYRAIEGL